jgi:hypothetical protein
MELTNLSGKTLEKGSPQKRASKLSPITTVEDTENLGFLPLSASETSMPFSPFRTTFSFLIDDDEPNLLEEQLETETDFLKKLLKTSQHSELHDRINERLSALARHDFAGEYSKMKARKIAFRRMPAILTTISLELLVGVIIAQYKTVIQKVGCFKFL